MVTVTKVNLPDRHRARFEAESNQQRALKPHDIRSSIPLVDYTNPAKFPPYQFREYPKMPLLDNNLPIVIDEAGGILVFYDAADEVDFKDMNPEIAEEIERNTPSKTMAETYAAQQTEMEGLRARLRAAGLEDTVAATKKPPANALAGVARPAAPRPKPNRASAAAAPAAEPGLREALPKTGDTKAAGNPLTRKRN